MIIEHDNIPCLVLRKENVVFNGDSKNRHFYLCVKGEKLIYLTKLDNGKWREISAKVFNKYYLITDRIELYK